MNLKLGNDLPRIDRCEIPLAKTGGTPKVSHNRMHESVLIRRFAYSALLVGFLSIRAIAADPSFTRQADVVIMTGLPGDVESEHRFEEQAKLLLEGLALKDSLPKSVHVLIDDPSAITLPAGMAGDVKAASRDNFLALGKTFEGSVDPVVVFAWGHAGLQRATPVFHVRGQRITPDDFATFAASLAKAPSSRWVLLFRGSGSFAKAVRSEHASVLSSELETAFTSDPVSVDLLAGIMRDHAGVDFTAMTNLFAAKTVAWYVEKNLARQEEPTLWTGNDEPVMLAKAIAASGTTPGASPAASPNPGGAQAGMPGEWGDIKPVDASKFPDDAVILRRSIQYVLGEDPAISEEQDEYIQILTANGKQYGDFDIAYSPPDETVTFLDCEVRQPDGSVVRLDPDEIRDAENSDTGEYKMEHRKIFSLPHVGAGAILHVHYRSEWKRFPLPHTFLDIPLAESIPIADQSVEVRVSSKSAFHFVFNEAAAQDPVISKLRDPHISQTTYGSVYGWDFKDLPAMTDELLTPPHWQPTLLVSTFPDWEAFASWYVRLTRDADEITPEITAKAAEVVHDCKSDREKIVALYSYVTNLRYVAVPLGVNSFRPHAAANVLKNSYGDCKDKANLFDTLLRSQGIDAHLVLVPRFDQAHEGAPGLAFNHAISQIRLGGEIIWADTTDGICRFGLLPPGDTGRNVLVIDGKTTSLTTLPTPAADSRGMSIKDTVNIASASEPAECAIDVETSGYTDYQLRAAAMQVSPHKTTEPVLAAQYRPVCGLLEMARQNFTSISDVNQPFAWKARGRWSGLVTATPDRGRSLLRAPFWLPSEWQAALTPRKSPLFLNEGYPLTLDQQIDFTLPDGAGAELPQAQKSDTGPLRWQIEWTKAAANKITAHFRLELESGEISADDTAKFQKQLDALYTAVSQAAFLTLH